MRPGKAGMGRKTRERQFELFTMLFIGLLGRKCLVWTPGYIVDDCSFTLLRAPAEEILYTEWGSIAGATEAGIDQAATWWSHTTSRDGVCIKAYYACAHYACRTFWPVLSSLLSWVNHTNSDIISLSLCYMFSHKSDILRQAVTIIPCIIIDLR